MSAASASAAMDVDGDEFMQPSGAAAAAQNANKFARPVAGAGVPSSLFSFGKDESKSFSKQYAAVYFTRLQSLKQSALDAAAAELHRFSHLSSGGEAPKLCTRVLDMTSDAYCVIAGTLYKDMKLKPSILKEYSKTAGHASTTTADGQLYMSPDDTLILEDEFGRVQLTGTAEALPVQELVTGLVASVLGREVAGGKFEVVALFVPGMAPQKALPAPLAAKESRPPAYLLCVSGLSMGLPGADPTPVQLLMDYVTGLLGSTAEQRNSASIVRVLLAGNSLHRFEKRKSGKESFQVREEADNDEAAVPLRELDVLLTQLSAAVPVDILPGGDDPSNFTLPQQPFHKCLFPSASTYSTFNRTTNPAWMQIDGLETLVTAGQNVADLAKYCAAPAPIDFVENSLRWRSVAPTAPDTLGCYPYQHKDPFVLQESPHLYIVGNQSAYASRLVRGPSGQMTRAVCVPSFAQTGTAVLIDLHSPTLDTQAISFQVQTA